MPLVLVAATSLVSCGTAPVRTPDGPRASAPKPAAESTAAKPARSGNYYLDDGPASSPPANLESIPDPKPRSEPLHRFANNPYSALGQDFVPERTIKPFRQRGLASWYGRRFHGNKTATGEIYDMFQLTGAHPTLPLPSYARITNTQNGRQIVVRVNDRGPFLRNRVMDLSYAAALKLGYVEQGVAMIEIETIVPSEVDRLAASGTPAPVGGPERMVDAKANRFPLFAESEGVFVQIGAFLLAENAESLRARLTLELSNLIGSMRVVARNGMHRLWAGPFGTQQEARVMADRIAGQFQ
ncbi:MAG: septal ring lytic transglycosylase RlpA family protein [Burkholderiales bacterium]